MPNLGVLRGLIVSRHPISHPRAAVVISVRPVTGRELGADLRRLREESLAALVMFPDPEHERLVRNGQR